MKMYAIPTYAETFVFDVKTTKDTKHLQYFMMNQLK